MIGLIIIIVIAIYGVWFLSVPRFNGGIIGVKIKYLLLLMLFSFIWPLGIGAILVSLFVLTVEICEHSMEEVFPNSESLKKIKNFLNKEIKWKKK